MAITYALMERFEQLSESQPERCQLIKKARVTKINKEGNRAVGVVYELDGQEVTVDGPVILATGGYAADFTDNSLLKKHRPDVYDLATTNGQHATGDGQKMLMAIGANGIDMDKVQVHPTGLIDPKDPTSKWKFLAAEGRHHRRQSTLLILQLSVARVAFSSTGTADDSATISATATTSPT